LTEALTKLGLKVTPSVGNFVLIHFPDSSGKRAPDADGFLSKRGVVLRRMEAYGLPNALRMTVGSAEANETTIAALAEFLGKKA
jgi:histidinol-phosphate aminotransferase